MSSPCCTYNLCVLCLVSLIRIGNTPSVPLGLKPNSFENLIILSYFVYPYIHLYHNLLLLSSNISNISFTRRI
jgi:hypothetical protein